MTAIEVCSVSRDGYHDLSVMVGELLNEIMDAIDEKVFSFDQKETESRAKRLIEDGRYWAFVAQERASRKRVGFVSLYESYSLYTEGAYGTIPELYVRPDWRSKQVGRQLLTRVTRFGNDRGWRRLEVTTPPLPQFQRTVQFYQRNGFAITGGRKLKLDLGSA